MQQNPAKYGGGADPDLAVLGVITTAWRWYPQRLPHRKLLWQDDSGIYLRTYHLLTGVVETLVIKVEFEAGSFCGLRQIVLANGDDDWLMR